MEESRSRSTCLKALENSQFSKNSDARPQNEGASAHAPLRMHSIHVLPPRSAPVRAPRVAHDLRGREKEGLVEDKNPPGEGPSRCAKRDEAGPRAQEIPPAKLAPKDAVSPNQQ